MLCLGMAVKNYKNKMAIFVILYSHTTLYKDIDFDRKGQHKMLVYKDKVL